jgi:hypothetical protein
MKRIVDFNYFKEIKIKEPSVLLNPQRPGGFLGGYSASSKN